MANLINICRLCLKVQKRSNLGGNIFEVNAMLKPINTFNSTIGNTLSCPPTASQWTRENLYISVRTIRNSGKFNEIYFQTPFTPFLFKFLITVPSSTRLAVDGLQEMRKVNRGPSIVP